MSVEQVGIVGCGAMGAGIAQLALQSGYGVVVREINEDLLTKGIKRIRGAFDKMCEKGTLGPSERDGFLSKMTGTVSIDDLGPCDLVIEAVFEDMDVKLELVNALDRVCKPDTILASNTSSLSISRMAASTRRPDRLVGLHFFNPPTVMPLVEVIRTIKTDPDVFRGAVDFVKSLKKTPVSAKDNAGFIVNLLLTPYLLDSIRALQDGVASTADIDAAMKLGCNHPMGPLMLADFIGLDVLRNAANTLFDEYREKRYAPPPLLVRMVTMGMYGLKAGKGFYDWSDGRNPKPADLGL